MRFLRKIPIHPVFYLVVAFFIVTGRAVEFFNFVVALTIHELGHYFVSKKLGYSLEKFYIMPYGACLSYKEKQFERVDEIKIAVAGPLLNIIFAISLISFWWIFPVTYVSSFSLVEQNLFLAFFNLIPAYPLDGGRMFLALLSNKVGRKKGFKIIQIANVCFSLAFFAMFIISFYVSFNPMFALVCVFLISGLLQGDFAANYKNSFLFKKKISDFAKPKVLLVKDDLIFKDLLKKIDRDTYTIFDVVSKKGEMIALTEEQVVNICAKFDVNNKLSKLFDD